MKLSNFFSKVRELSETVSFFEPSNKLFGRNNKIIGGAKYSEKKMFNTCNYNHTEKSLLKILFVTHKNKIFS